MYGYQYILLPNIHAWRHRRIRRADYPLYCKQRGIHVNHRTPSKNKLADSSTARNVSRREPRDRWSLFCLPFLKTLEFELYVHLNHIGGSINGRFMKSIKTAILSSETYRGVPYAHDDDPIGPLQHVQSGCGNWDPKQIRTELEKQLKTAEDSGMSKERASKLCEITNAFEDIFGITSGRNRHRKSLCRT